MILEGRLTGYFNGRQARLENLTFGHMYCLSLKGHALCQVVIMPLGAGQPKNDLSLISGMPCSSGINPHHFHSHLCCCMQERVSCMLINLTGKEAPIQSVFWQF
jgi:hypothetical protein